MAQWHQAAKQAIPIQFLSYTKCGMDLIWIEHNELICCPNQTS